MLLRGKKLGLLLSTRPDNPGFRQGVRLAEEALRRGIHVYLYCIDEAISGVSDPQLQALKARGLNLYGCAHSALRHNVPLNDAAAFAGLTIVSDLMAGTDRFLSFN